ncbi:MAG: hypothetical protein A3H96_00180 [Acidobacteria bacterium RIFCSPLOWO2_02_FULL_67_36]|nr:MAG: hypothetical protein A3H96_00180 [Acidobacteria bacterium RIFCSPLOWO2_02_FULL_67_36]OFW19606.1 MAG: hypothetical protein A3G21_21620 [Acidobacteria bacterium RIFCSPLOWO2_12_FULL_66_21]
MVAIAALLSIDGCARQTTPPARWRVRFGPIVGPTVIVGHVNTRSEAWLMTGADSLVHVNLEDGRSTTTKLEPLALGEHPWGLALLADGTLWTLLGRSVLGQVSPQGRVLRRIPLTRVHVGLFGGGRQLLYQVINFDPPVEALLAGPPGEAERRPWSGMRTRAFPLARAAVAALNFVSCGQATEGTIPCWFPDQAAVTLTDRSGASRELRLEGLPTVAPEVLLTSENPRRPVRDALLSQGGFLWVLGSGTPPRTEPTERPGGWLLNRYDSRGVMLHRMQLPEPARLLLSATDDGCLMLSTTGYVIEVHP